MKKPKISPKIEVFSPFQRPFSNTDDEPKALYEKVMACSACCACTACTACTACR